MAFIAFRFMVGSDDDPRRSDHNAELCPQMLSVTILSFYNIELVLYGCYCVKKKKKFEIH